MPSTLHGEATKSPVGQPVAGPLHPGVRERRPQPGGVVLDQIEALERLGGERVLVVDSAVADHFEGGLIPPGPGGLPPVDQLVDGHCEVVSATALSNTGSPSSGVDASA